jgi:predicted  nucleic acid-binding Zn-ribbon protein
MDFEKILNDTKKAVKKAVQTTIKVSSDAIDYSKCKLKISSLNAKIDDNYSKIGNFVYSQSLSYDANNAEEIEKLCEEITSWKEEIEVLNNLIKKESDDISEEE